MALKLQNRPGSEVATGQPSLPVENPSMESNIVFKQTKKKGGSPSVLPKKRRLVKTMAFLSVVQFFSSIFCTPGTPEPGSARSSPPGVGLAKVSKQMFPKPSQDKNSQSPNASPVLIKKPYSPDLTDSRLI